MINESFNNIKTVKLFSWENQFVDSIDRVYKEELQFEDTKVLRESFFTFI